MDSNHEERNIGPWVDNRLEALSPEATWEPDLQRGLARFRRERSRAGGRRRRWMWLTAGTATACLSLMATPATRAFAQRCVSACVSESGFLHSLLVSVGKPGASVAYVMPDRRQIAPDFTLPDSTGAAVKLSDFRGKVVLLNFWATWCAPCRTEIPWFVEFQRTHAEGFEVLGISLDDDGWKSVRPYIEEKKMNYPVMLGTDEVTRRYAGAQSLPTTLIIDKSGRIAAMHVGLCSRSEYEGDIKTVLNE
jgi:cytochrome c biogenesis protein CcmG/thiol:disulfide interchange protein DsbE